MTNRYLKKLWQSQACKTRRYSKMSKSKEKKKKLKKNDVQMRKYVGKASQFK